MIEVALWVIVSWYSPVLGGINCDSRCDILAGGLSSAWGYGKSVACPPAIPYGSSLYITGVGHRSCYDVGGAAIVCGSWDIGSGCAIDVQSYYPIVTDRYSNNRPFRRRAMTIWLTRADVIRLTPYTIHANSTNDRELYQWLQHSAPK
jgi:hypothetical protein